VKAWIEALVTSAHAQEHLSPGDEADTGRIPPGGTPGYTAYTLRGGWQPYEFVTLTLSVENITNKDYRIHGSGQNEAGTNFIMGLDVRY
jgi:hemoglobin/transferrin/lactoferrin receptor protein